MTAVLVIEDDGVVARAMGAYLRNGGFDVEWAEDGTKGLRKLRFERPDVCVVDLMLPGLDGWGLIERARDEGLMTPILVVSARGNEHDKVSTLSLGADDYLAKPFGMAEFTARVHALARRAGITQPSDREIALEFPGLRIDPSQHRAFLVGGEGTATDAHLTRTEFRLLHQLARNDGRVLSRDELHQRVWDVPYRHRDRTVDVFVRKLREKLDHRSSLTYLHTHYGVGYRFGAETRRSAAPAATHRL
jgi:two-component system copper resistance phosphate regulon response regulator CusR